MKLIYKPFGIVFGLLAGMLSKKLFDAVWGVFDHDQPPHPRTQETSWPRVLGAAAVQGLTFSVTRAAIDRAGAHGFAHLTGHWPGPKQPDESQAAKAVR